MNANWNYPTAMRTGAGRVSELAEVCRDLKMDAPLLVTDPGLAGLPMLAEVVANCEAAGLSIKLFSDIKPNPTGTNVDNGILAYRKGYHDGVIAFGG